MIEDSGLESFLFLSLGYAVPPLLISVVGVVCVCVYLNVYMEVRG